MSAPLPIGRTEHCDCTEGKKHRAKNVSIPRPGEDCAGQRQEGEQSEVARLGIHFRPPIRRGSDQAALSARVDGLEPRMKCLPPRGRTAGHLSGSDRATRCPTGNSPPPGDASRPRPLGGVNELEYADLMCADAAQTWRLSRLPVDVARWAHTRRLSLEDLARSRESRRQQGCQWRGVPICEGLTMVRC